MDPWRVIGWLILGLVALCVAVPLFTIAIYNDMPGILIGLGLADLGVIYLIYRRRRIVKSRGKGQVR